MQGATYLESDPIGLYGGLNTYGYTGANPLRWADFYGLDVYQCSQPAFGWTATGPLLLDLPHRWLKTDTREAGMGGIRGNVPGNQSGDRPFDPVQVVDHTGRSKEPGASCEKVENVDEEKVNKQLRIGRPLGRWTPTNQCWSFVDEVLRNATVKPPQPTPPKP